MEPWPGSAAPWTVLSLAAARDQATEEYKEAAEQAVSVRRQAAVCAGFSAWSFRNKFPGHCQDVPHISGGLALCCGFNARVLPIRSGLPISAWPISPPESWSVMPLGDLPCACVLVNKHPPGQRQIGIEPDSVLCPHQYSLSRQSAWRAFLKWPVWSLLTPRPTPLTVTAPSHRPEGTRTPSGVA